MENTTIPTFGGNDSENTSGSSSDSEAETTVATLDLTESEIQTYQQYEMFVDMGRFTSKVRANNDSEAMSQLFSWIGEQKEAFRKECKKLAGNLPMFRAAYPVEDRLGDDLYVLPSEEAAKIGIDYEKQDRLVLPISDGVKWTPQVSCQADSEPEPEAEPVEDDDNDFLKACKNAGLETKVVDAVLEGYPIPSEGTVEDLKETLKVFVDTEDRNAIEVLRTLEAANKNRSTGLKAIDAALNAVEDSEDDDSDEFEGTETTTGTSEAVEALSDDDSNEVEAAKVEALKAAVGAIENLTEAIQNL